MSPVLLLQECTIEVEVHFRKEHIELAGTVARMLTHYISENGKFNDKSTELTDDQKATLKSAVVGIDALGSKIEDQHKEHEYRRLKLHQLRSRNFLDINQAMAVLMLAAPASHAGGSSKRSPLVRFLLRRTKTPRSRVSMSRQQVCAVVVAEECISFLTGSDGADGDRGCHIFDSEECIAESDGLAPDELAQKVATLLLRSVGIRIEDLIAVQALPHGTAEEQSCTFSRRDVIELRDEVGADVFAQKVEPTVTEDGSHDEHTQSDLTFSISQECRTSNSWLLPSFS